MLFTLVTVVWLSPFKRLVADVSVLFSRACRTEIRLGHCESSYACEETPHDPLSTLLYNLIPWTLAPKGAPIILSKLSRQGCKDKPGLYWGYQQNTLNYKRCKIWARQVGQDSYQFEATTEDNFH